MPGEVPGSVGRRLSESPRPEQAVNAEGGVDGDSANILHSRGP